MDATEVQYRPVPFSVHVWSALRTLIDVITAIFFKLYYGTKGNRIPPIKDDILKQPAVEVAKRIRAKQISSEDVVQICIQRIRDVNRQLNCLVEERFELALAEAKKADDLVRSGSKTENELAKEKPFLGVPFTTKDCIGVEGLHQTAGVVMRKDFIAEKDAESIKLLRDAGAIILGLTNVPELCMWYETYNKIHGRTNNPYDTNRIVGGSSGGEGCIQAAAGSCFGIGSDIGGSIRMPAYFNGIFGHKPSRKIVSNAGQYPLAYTEDQENFLCIGPMTRYAADLKPILKIISGENSKELNLDQPVNIGSLKIFYQISMNAPLCSDVDPEIVTVMKKVMYHFNVKHKISAEQKNIEWLQKSAPIWLITMRGNRSFGEAIIKDYAYWKNFREIVKCAVGLSDNTLIALLTSVIDKRVDEMDNNKYQLYRQIRLQLENIFKNMLGDNGIFLFPTHPTPAPYHNQPLIRPMNFMYTAIINCLGLPSTTVPLGLSKDGLPLGIQVIANHNNDRLCLAVAEELEKAFGGWVPPQS